MPSYQLRSIQQSYLAFCFWQVGILPPHFLIFVLLGKSTIFIVSASESSWSSTGSVPCTHIDHTIWTSKTGMFSVPAIQPHIAHKSHGFPLCHTVMNLILTFNLKTSQVIMQLFSRWCLSWNSSELAFNSSIFFSLIITAPIFSTYLLSNVKCHLWFMLLNSVINQI